MNYIEKIRKAIECPQFNNTRYGKWGALTLEQRTYIKILLNEVEDADKYIKKLYLENQKLKEVIDKAIKHVNKYESIKAFYEYIDEDGYDEYNCDEDFKKELLDILKGSD